MTRHLISMEESTLSRSNPAYVMKGIHFLLGNPAYVIKGIHFLLANPKEIHHRGLILLFKGVDISSSSETQGQSVGSGEKAGRKFSSTGERAPGYRLSPNYFKRMLAPDCAQKCFVLLCPIGEQFLLTVLFVSSCSTAIVSPHLSGLFTKLLRARETFLFYFPN